MEGMNGAEELRSGRIAAQSGRFAIFGSQLWLVVEKIHMRRPAAHREKNHPLRSWREMRRFRAQPALRLRQRRKRQPADAGGSGLENVAA